MQFGAYIRSVRETHQKANPRDWTLRQFAMRVGIEPSYLSKIERDLEKPPSEALIVRIAEELGEDKDVLLAMAGKLSEDLQAIIMQRPKLFAQVIRHLKRVPDESILHWVREVRDGEW